MGPEPDASKIAQAQSGWHDRSRMVAASGEQLRTTPVLVSNPAHKP
jgi:hypothetical protein